MFQCFDNFCLLSSFLKRDKGCTRQNIGGYAETETCWGCWLTPCHLLNIARHCFWSYNPKVLWEEGKESQEKTERTRSHFCLLLKSSNRLHTPQPCQRTVGNHHASSLRLSIVSVLALTQDRNNMTTMDQKICKNLLLPQSILQALWTSPWNPVLYQKSEGAKFEITLTSTLLVGKTHALRYNGGGVSKQTKCEIIGNERGSFFRGLP